jgi:hypothetical protein
MRVRLLCTVVGVTLIVSPAQRQAPRAPQNRTTVDQPSGAPLVQADLRPTKGLADSPSPTRTEGDDPAQIEPEPGVGRRSRNTRTATTTAGSKHTVERAVEITATAATTFDPIAQTDMALGSDPQIAVSEHFIVATTSGTVAFFDKQGNQLPRKSFLGMSLPTRMRATTLFAPLLEPFLRGTDGQPDPGQPNPDDINRHLGTQNGYPWLICTPDTPVQDGCISEAYDTRVTYDRERKLFWIVSALRDRVWGENFEHCDTKICARLSSHIPRRFVGVAVSLTEDPRDGFHEFVVLDEYADWPRFALHGPLLIVSHNSNTKVHLFNAEKLANGNAGRERVERGNFDDSDFDVDQIVPVVQHDRRDETDMSQSPFIPTRPVDPEAGTHVPTFLVGVRAGLSGGTVVTDITIFAFDPNDALLSTVRHPKMTRATVRLEAGSFRMLVNAVYRNGFIYVVGQRCVSGSDRLCNHEVQFLKIPVFRGSGPVASTIFASADRSAGFVETAFGGMGSDSQSMAGPSFEIPGVDVNKHDDVVIVYERSGFGANLRLDAPGAFFRLVTRAGVEKDGILHLARCGPSAEQKVRCAPQQPYQAHIDTAGIAVDPSDDTTIWMAHAIADAGLPSTQRYRMVIGQIKP